MCLLKNAPLGFASGSVVQEIGKPAEWHDVVCALVADFTDHNRTRRRPEQEGQVQEICGQPAEFVRTFPSLT